MFYGGGVLLQYYTEMGKLNSGRKEKWMDDDLMTMVLKKRGEFNKTQKKLLCKGKSIFIANRTYRKDHKRRRRR